MPGAWANIRRLGRGLRELFARRLRGGAATFSAAPHGTDSRVGKASEEECDVAAAAANTANQDTNSSSDVSMPWVKELPVHLLAAYFQRMPPPLKLQVEMTTQRMANIMKAHGWRKYDSIDIVIPVDDDSDSGLISVRVNTFVVDVDTTETDDDGTVDSRELVDCVQLLLRRIRPRRFSLTYATRAQLTAAHLDEDDTYDYGLCDEILSALVKSKADGVAITELRLYGYLSKVGKAITTFADTLTHLTTPRYHESCSRWFDATIDAIKKCDHLEELEFDRDYDVDSGVTIGPEAENALKDALSNKKSLKRLALSPSVTSPLNVLVPGVYHHLTHLTVGDLYWLSGSAEEDALLSNLTVFASDLFDPTNMGSLLRALRMAQKPERLHLAELLWVSEGDDLGAFVPENFEYDKGPTSCYLITLVKAFADHCYHYRRSLVFSCQFPLFPLTVSTEDDQEMTERDDQAMLAAMMKFDKEFVTSSKLSHFGLMAFDERLYEFDESLTPPTMEHPPQITSIDGSHVYKRQFMIEVRSHVRLTIAFDESPAIDESPDYTHDITG